MSHHTRPQWGELLKENIGNFLWLAGGVVFLFLGLFDPKAGSAIILFILSFSELGSSARHAQPSAAYAWLVFFFALIGFVVGGIGLIRWLFRQRASRLGGSEPPRAP